MRSRCPAINHIEVLHDGASAHTGPTPSSGVINIVLKERPAGPTAALKFGLSGVRRGNSCAPNGLRSSRVIILTLGGGLADAGGHGASGLEGQLTVAADTRATTARTVRRSTRATRSSPGDAGQNAVTEPDHRWGIRTRGM